MEITRSSLAGCIRLALRGRFDAAWSQDVQAALDECVRGGQHLIELDLSEVVFLSSAGIRVLLLTYRQLRGIDGRLAVVAASAEVRQVIELAGLRALLAAAEPAAAREPVAVAPQQLERGGGRFEVHVLEAGARIAVRALGDPAALLRDGVIAGGLVHESFPPPRLAVGVGAFGSTPDGCHERLGELLAVAGAAVTLPTSGEGRPDWLLCQDRLVPEAQLAYGLVGAGAFAHLVRFAALAEGGSLGLEALIDAALAVAGAEAVAVAAVAEVAELVGAALRRSPAGHGGGLFAFPAVREQLDFTAEPVHAGSVAVLAGFAARRPPAALAAHLRPLDGGGAVAAHVHAAVFPYRPIRRGRIALDATVRELFEGQNVLGLLHLLADPRPSTGAGQSSFYRGALWCAPLELA